MTCFENINQKYIALCAKHGVCVDILTTEEPQSSIVEENGGILLKMPSNAPAHLGYEKVLSWRIRELLLPQLVLKTERLIIRRFASTDRDLCLPFLENREDAYMDCSRAFEEIDGDYRARVELFLQRKTQYAITLQKTGELIGTVYIFPDEARAVDAMEIGYRIAHRHQRMGYATEALIALLDLLLNGLCVDMISAGVLPENAASIGLLKKLGFQKEGLRHGAIWHETLDKAVALQYFFLEYFNC